MKTLILESSSLTPIILKKATTTIIVVLFLLSWVNAQTYNPQTGNTHYPNGTIYIGTSPHTGGPVVIGPEREDGSWERVECDENQASEKRCGEILEEATPDKDGKTPDNGSGESDSGGDATTQAFGAEIAAESSEYHTKQLKINYGVWTKQNGKWMYATNSREWTAQIIRSWKKKK